MRLLEKRTEVENEIMKMYNTEKRNTMKENQLRNIIHENNSSILSGRAGAGQQLATSYRWFAVFLLVSPSFSVLSLPLSS